MTAPESRPSKRRRLLGRAAALPLRRRLVAGFVVAMSVVLAAAGSFVYWRVSHALDLRLNHEAREGIAALQPLINPDGTLRADPSTGATSAGRLFQVINSNGTVLAAGADLGTGALLPIATLRSAAKHAVPVDVGALLPRSTHPLRVYVVKPTPAPSGVRFLLVAVRRDQRDEALRELLAQLSVAGLVCLIVTGLVGERLARAALTPVERYRTQAARIADGATGVRLDVPTGRDDEVTRLGQTLNTMLEALEENVVREKLFTAEASHELRTPLTVLSTRVQLALSRPRSHAELLETLHALGQEITELSQLADGLLALTTTTEQMTSPNGAALQMNAVGPVLRGIVADYADVSLHSSGVPSLPGGDQLRLTGPQLRQIVRNLLTNAQTHGAPPLTLAVTVVGHSKRVLRLTVTDHGPGMPPGFVPRAVERFARAEDAQNRPGAGLGLALVHDVVAQAGGELRMCVNGSHHRFHATDLRVLCEHPDRGTVATVLLPFNR